MIYRNNHIKPTQEMKDYHEKRIAIHVGLVGKFLKKFKKEWESNPIKGLLFKPETVDSLIAEHDLDKRTPGKMYDLYSLIDHHYMCALQEIECKLPYTDEMDDATKLHITTNKHHAEYWDMNYKPTRNNDFSKRDSLIKLNPPDGSDMPDNHLVEMCADMCATAQERGNTALDYISAAKKYGRYVFADDQWNYIFQIMKIMEA